MDWSWCRAFSPSKGCVLLLLAWLLWPQGLAARPVVLPCEPGSAGLGGQVEYHVDASGQADLTVVQALHQAGEFRPLPGEALNLGYERGVVWLRAEFAGPDCRPHGGWYLDLNSPPYYLSLDVYTRGGDATFWRQERFGLLQGREPRPLPLELAPGEVQTVYLALNQVHGIMLVPQLRTAAEQARHEAVQLGLAALSYGVLGALLLYNLFLWLSARDRSYLWYCAHLLLALLFIAYKDPAASLLGINLQSEWAFRLHLVNNLLVLATAALFARSFLRLRRGLNRVLLGYALGMTVLVPWGLQVSLQDFGPVLGPLGLLTSLLLLGVAGYQVTRGDRPARIFLVAWGLYLVFWSVHALTCLGGLPLNLFTAHALRLGSCGEALLLSFALAYRLRLLQTQTIRAEADRERLSKENTLLQLILENSHLGICFSQEGRAQWANQRFWTLLGHSGPPPEEELDMNRLCVDEDQCPLIWTAAPDTENEGVLLRRDGSTMHYRLLWSTLPEGSGYGGEVWILEDASQRKHYEELQRDAEAIARHDLKNTLFAIIAYPSLIAAGGNLDTEQQRLCRVIEDSGRTMLHMINLSLSMRRIETGTFRPELEPVDLHAILRQCVEFLRPLQLEKRIAVRVIVNGEEGGVRTALAQGDALLCFSVLGNLLRNALEAAPEGSTVEAAIRCNGTCSVLLSNVGEVPEAIRGRFFEKYVTSGKRHGSGLGTYCVRLFTRAMGGGVHLHTGVPGRTSVEVMLSAPSGAAPSATEPGTTSPDLGPLREVSDFAPAAGCGVPRPPLV